MLLVHKLKYRIEPREKQQLLTLSKIPRIVAPVEDSLIRLFCPEMNTEKFSQILELY